MLNSKGFCPQTQKTGENMSPPWTCSTLRRRVSTQTSSARGGSTASSPVCVQEKRSNAFRGTIKFATSVPTRRLSALHSTTMTSRSSTKDAGCPARKSQSISGGSGNAGTVNACTTGCGERKSPPCPWSNRGKLPEFERSANRQAFFL